MKTGRGWGREREREKPNGNPKLIFSIASMQVKGGDVTTN